MAETPSSLSTLFDKYAFAFTLSNPRDIDNPIIYASESFFELSGYSCDEVLGRNCRFLQGPGTDRQAVLELRDAMREERSTSVCLLNYKKGGRTFWNALTIFPVKDDSGMVAYYLGLQADVTSLVTSDNVQEGDVQRTVEIERERASQLAADLAMHREEIAAACHATCASDNSVPSSLLGAICGIQACFVLADPNLPDMPMVYCSPQFLRLTGYSCKELIGENCRLLQGPDTDPAQVRKMRDALTAQPPRAVTATVLNYKKCGKPFYNCVHIAPVRDADGKVQFFCGVQLDVTASAVPPGQGISTADAAILSTSEEPGATEVPPGGDAPLPPPAPSPLSLLQQKGVVGAVRVAARALSSHGLRREAGNQQPITPRSGGSLLNSSPFKE